MLQARCHTTTGNTQHYIGTVQDGQVVRHTKIEDPEYVQIEEGDNGYYLFRYNSVGICVSDSWFEALDQAKEQARFEFDILPHQWEEIE